MTTTSLRNGLFGLLLFTTPALAESPFPKETLEELASIKAYISECTDREFLPEVKTGELSSIILEITHLPDVNTKWFISESETRIADIEGLSDSKMANYCAALNNHTIRWSMKYWKMFQEHAS